MKKYSLLITIALLGGAFTTLPAQAGPMVAQQAQPKFQSDEERAAYEAYYNEKDPAKKIALAKAFGEKFPTSEYKKFTDAAVVNDLGVKFQADLKGFYDSNPPSAPALEKLLGSGEEFLKVQPDQPYIVSQLALATGRGVLAQVYNDIPKARSYADKALTLLESSTPPQGFPAEQWSQLRTVGRSTLNQYQGLYYTRENPPNPEKAIEYLSKTAEMKDGPAAKDPNTYWLRGSAYNTQYEALSGEYRKLPDDQKTSEAGKAVLAKIDPVVDKMIEDYARVYALSKDPQAKQLRDASKELLDSFWKYRNNNKLDGLDAYIKSVEADPTGSHPPKFAAPAPSNELGANAPPSVNTSQPKLSANQETGGGAKASTKSSKSTSAKGKSKRGRRG